MARQDKIRVGIVGTGFVGRGLSILLSKSPEMEVSQLLTRRRGNIPGLGVDREHVTREPGRLMETSDIIVVSTGNPVYSTEIIDTALSHGLPVVTMDADTLVLSGSWLSRKGLITEAEGDQPGSLAALGEEVVQMGFNPLVYGNIKWFLNHHPTLADMTYWSGKQGYSLPSVTSFTDGTKVQIEQCLVANGLNADILKQGLAGPEAKDLEEGALGLADKARSLGRPISDYILCPNAPPGVFIAATHEESLAWGLETYKLGKGPVYVLHRPHHLCFFEIPKTINRLIHSKKVLLDNGLSPRVGVASIAKTELRPGCLIEKGIGSMEVRGETVNILEQPDHVPIGLMSGAHIRRTVLPGQLITRDDVDIPESMAARAWEETLSLLRKKNP